MLPIRTIDDRPHLERAAQLAHDLGLRRARRDSAFFVGQLLGYDIQPFQQRWHDAIAAHDRVVVWAPVETGKTQQLGIGYPVWRLGKRPRTRGLIVGKSETHAQKILGAIRRLIDEAPYVREVFPDLKPLEGKYAKWTDEAIRIAGAAAGEKDYTLQACGIGGAILGARLDWVLLDDVLDFENTLTLHQRQKVIRWFTSTVIGRLLPGALVMVLGNAWFADDLMHVLVKDSGYHEVRDQTYDELPDGSVNPSTLLWPTRWPLERIQQRIREVGIVEARRQLRSRPYSQGGSKFQLEWFDQAFALGDAAGARILERYAGPLPTFGGVDLGVSEEETASETVFWIITFDPDRGTRRPIYVETGRYTGPQILERLRDLHARFGCPFMVENVAAQDYLVQFAADTPVPVTGFTTGRQKADPRFGVPSIAHELAAGKWELSRHDEIYKWRAECLAYAPGQKTGDRLMASWFAREGSRMSMVAGDTVEPAQPTHGQYGRMRARYTYGSRRGGLRLIRSHVA